MADEYTPGGGLSAGWQQRLTPEEENSREIQKLLFQHSKPYSERYAEWADEHPIQNFALETTLDTASTLFPYGRVLRQIPRIGKALGEAVEMYQRSGGLGEWSEGAAPHISDPKYRLDPRSKTPEKAEYTVRRTGDDQPIGSMKFNYNDDIKQLYLGWASKDPGTEELGTGQMMHLFNEAGKDFPDAETVRFFRIENMQKVGGGTVGRKGYTEEVTMPLRGRGDPEMKKRFIERERLDPEFMGPMPGKKESRVIRRRMEEPETDDVDIMPNYSLLRDLSDRDREIVDLMESGELDRISYHSREKYPERLRVLGSDERALEAGDALRDKTLQQVIEERRRETGIMGPIPNFEQAYDRGIHLERRATVAAMRQEEQRLTDLLRQLGGDPDRE